MTARTRAAGPRTVIAAHGLSASLPERWEARLYRRDRPTGAPADPANARGDLAGLLRRSVAPHPAAYGHAGESTNPVLHLANFALPPGRGDFGTGAVELMEPAHAFVSLLEYDPSEAGRPLFAARGLPRPGLRDFAPNALQRRLAGQLGSQTFFTEQDRAFCLYVVLGSRRHASSLVDQLHDVLDGVEVGRRDVL